MESLLVPKGGWGGASLSSATAGVDPLLGASVRCPHPQGSQGFMHGRAIAVNGVNKDGETCYRVVFLDGSEACLPVSELSLCDVAIGESRPAISRRVDIPPSSPYRFPMYSQYLPQQWSSRTVHLWKYIKRCNRKIVILPVVALCFSWLMSFSTRTTLALSLAPFIYLSESARYLSALCVVLLIGLSVRAVSAGYSMAAYVVRRFMKILDGTRMLFASVRHGGRSCGIPQTQAPSRSPGRRVMSMHFRHRAAVASASIVSRVPFIWASAEDAVAIIAGSVNGMISIAVQSPDVTVLGISVALVMWLSGVVGFVAGVVLGCLVAYVTAVFGFPRYVRDQRFVGGPIGRVGQQLHRSVVAQNSPAYRSVLAQRSPPEVLVRIGGKNHAAPPASRVPAVAVSLPAQRMPRVDASPPSGQRMPTVVASTSSHSVQPAPCIPAVAASSTHTAPSAPMGDSAQAVSANQHTFGRPGFNIGRLGLLRSIALPTPMPRKSSVGKAVLVIVCLLLFVGHFIIDPSAFGRQVSDSEADWHTYNAVYIPSGFGAGYQSISNWFQLFASWLGVAVPQTVVIASWASGVLTASTRGMFECFCVPFRFLIYICGVNLGYSEDETFAFLNGTKHWEHAAPHVHSAFNIASATSSWYISEMFWHAMNGLVIVVQFCLSGLKDIAPFLHSTFSEALWHARNGFDIVLQSFVSALEYIVCFGQYSVEASVHGTNRMRETATALGMNSYTWAADQWKETVPLVQNGLGKASTTSSWCLSEIFWHMVNGFLVMVQCCISAFQNCLYLLQAVFVAFVDGANGLKDAAAYLVMSFIAACVDGADALKDGVTSLATFFFTATAYGASVVKNGAASLGTSTYTWASEQWDETAPVLHTALDNASASSRWCMSAVFGHICNGWFVMYESVMSAFNHLIAAVVQMGNSLQAICQWLFSIPEYMVFQAEALFYASADRASVVMESVANFGTSKYTVAAEQWKEAVPAMHVVLDTASSSTSSFFSQIVWHMRNGFDILCYPMLWVLEQSEFFGHLIADASSNWVHYLQGSFSELSTSSYDRAIRSFDVPIPPLGRKLEEASPASHWLLSTIFEHVASGAHILLQLVMSMCPSTLVELALLLGLALASAWLTEVCRGKTPYLIERLAGLGKRGRTQDQGTHSRNTAAFASSSTRSAQQGHPLATTSCVHHDAQPVLLRAFSDVVSAISPISRRVATPQRISPQTYAADFSPPPLQAPQTPAKDRSTALPRTQNYSSMTRPPVSAPSSSYSSGVTGLRQSSHTQQHQELQAASQPRYSFLSSLGFPSEDRSSLQHVPTQHGFDIPVNGASALDVATPQRLFNKLFKKKQAQPHYAYVGGA